MVTGLSFFGRRSRRKKEDREIVCTSLFKGYVCFRRGQHTKHRNVNGDEWTVV